ncbi:hypothetical protein CAL7716_071530 [Calothrix sp. PCC 7716]|nr:hypothetical protein CAL7716_071530 [Calothrix sp. PCC 7716]
MEVKISPENYTPSEKLGAELVDHIAENGKVIPCVQKGSVKVAIDKANIYCMGKVPMYPQEELQQLQRFKQSNRYRSTSKIIRRNSTYISNTQLYIFISLYINF